MASVLTVTCAICKKRLDPHKHPVRLDGRYLCVDCRVLADFVDHAVAWQASSQNLQES